MGSSKNKNNIKTQSIAGQILPMLDPIIEEKAGKNLEEIKNGEYDLLNFNDEPNALKDLLKSDRQS